MTATTLRQLPVCLLGLAMGLNLPVAAQGAARPTLAQRLGYDADARLLIVHADDIGMAHSVNQATLRAMQEGVITSGSIMVPCPWFPEIAQHVREHPGLDLGLHLTLTSEWNYYRWGPVLPADQVPTLLDSTGFLYATAEAAVEHMDPSQAEAEIRAQVERAIAFGIQPTHLDSHMGTLFTTPELFAAYLRVGREHGIPVLVPGDLLRMQAPQLVGLLQPEDIVIDHLVTMAPGVPAGEWDTFYARLVEQLQPGVTEIIVHIAYDDDEMRAATIDQPDWGATWRQLDFDAMTNPLFKRLLEQNDVHLITWREIESLLK